MPDNLTLNTIISSRQRRILGVVVLDFKAEEGNSHEDGKAIGKQMFSGSRGKEF